MAFPSYSEPPALGSELEYRLDGTCESRPSLSEAVPASVSPTGGMWRGLSLAGGLSLLALGVALVSLYGSSHADAAALACALGLGCLGLTLGLGDLRANATIACSLVAACLVLAPSDWVARYRDARQLESPDLATRTETMRRLAADGRRDFPNASVGGADLSHIDVSHGDLSGADLRNAKLDRAFLGGVNLERARLEGAEITGADLTGASLGGSTGFERTLCDLTTQMPAGWSCVHNVPLERTPAGP